MFTHYIPVAGGSVLGLLPGWEVAVPGLQRMPSFPGTVVDMVRGRMVAVTWVKAVHIVVH